MTTVDIEIFRSKTAVEMTNLWKYRHRTDIEINGSTNVGRETIGKERDQEIKGRIKDKDLKGSCEFQRGGWIINEVSV